MNTVGTARIYKSNQPGAMRVFLSKTAKDLIGDDIVFDKKKLIIRRPTIDSKKTYSIRAKIFSLCCSEEDEILLEGIYHVIQKDEDTFKLKKCQKTE